MGKFLVKQSVDYKVVPISESFQFTYGNATVSLSTNGMYSLSANGSEYSEYVNSARRAYGYKPALRNVTEKMRESYDRLTGVFTQLHCNLSPAQERTSYEKALDKLVLRKYRNKPFRLKEPTEEKIRKELEDAARQQFFRTFGTDNKRIVEYINANVQDAMAQRKRSWEELSKYHDCIQAQNAAKQNQIYYKEYTEKKEELENILAGPARYVDATFKKALSEIRLPFDIEIDYAYSQSSKRLTVDVEVPTFIPIPDRKATILSSGKISIKNKTLSDQKHDLELCLYGLPYYLASKFFDISVNIETICLSLWVKGKERGLLWVEFHREEFEGINGRNRDFSPLFFLSLNKHYSAIESSSIAGGSYMGQNKTVFLSGINSAKMS